MSETPEAAASVPLETARLLLRRLAPGDEAALQAAFDGAGDHFAVVTGQPQAAPDAAEREIRACEATPGRQISLATLREGGETVGVVGWWAGNPAPDVALLGTLIVLPAHRGQGLGREMLEAAEGWLRAHGTTRLRTAIGRRRHPVHAVLRRLGFAEMSIRDHTYLGARGAGTALFEKPLA